MRCPRAVPVFESDAENIYISLGLRTSGVVSDPLPNPWEIQKWGRCRLLEVCAISYKVDPSTLLAECLSEYTVQVIDGYDNNAEAVSAAQAISGIEAMIPAPNGKTRFMGFIGQDVNFMARVVLSEKYRVFDVENLECWEHMGSPGDKLWGPMRRRRRQHRQYRTPISQARRSARLFFHRIGVRLKDNPIE